MQFTPRPCRSSSSKQQPHPLVRHDRRPQWSRSRERADSQVTFCKKREYSSNRRSARLLARWGRSVEAHRSGILERCRAVHRVKVAGLVRAVGFGRRSQRQREGTSVTVGRAARPCGGVNVQGSNAIRLHQGSGTSVRSIIGADSDRG